MVKKVVVITIIVVALALIVAGYFFIKRQSRQLAANTINAVPINAAIIIETNNFHKLLNKIQKNNKIWNELTNIQTFQKINHHILFLDSLFEHNKKVKDLISGGGDNSVIISTHLTGKNRFEFLYLLSLSNVSEKKYAKSFLNDLLSQYKGTNISQRTYNNVKVYDVRLTKEQNIKSFSYAFSKGVFILSFSSILVEDAIRQLNTQNSVLTDYGFKKVLNTAGKNVEANIYINYKIFPKLISIFLNNKYKSFIRSFTNFANWAELDVNIKNDALLLNGFTYTNDSVNNYLNIFLNQTPQRINLESVLPANTSTFIALGISDFSLFKKDYKQYLEQSGEIYIYNKEINRIKNEYDIDIEEILYSIVEKEIAIAFTDINSLDINQNTYVILRIKSKAQAEKELLKILKSFAKKHNKELSSYISKYKIDEETSYPVYQMPVQYIAGKLFGTLFSKAETEYFTFIDNYVIFGNSVKSLSKFIHYNILHKTLSNDLHYNQFSDYLSSKSNFYFYTNLARSTALLASYLNDELSRDIRKENNINILRKFQAFAIQFISDKKMIYNNVFIKYNPIFKEEPRTVWESHLDTAINFKPRFVINHNTNEKEIFIQDLKNTIYLINSAGRILWKMQLPEQIISDIYQIDFYNNNKLQLLFSTTNYMHLIDRIGNYVERYPVKLKSPATNPITVFDYENNKDYRIFVACKDKKVYTYTKEGNIVKGWEFAQTGNFVYSPVQHFRLDGADYIVFSDTLKTYMLDRRGNIRFKIASDFSKSSNNIFTLENKTTKSEARLVTTDTYGMVYYIYFDGRVKSLKIKNYSPNHFFEYKDIDGDKFKDFIFVDKKMIEVINQDKISIFSSIFEENINLKPVCYLFPNNEIKIGISSQPTNEIFLFNSDGTLYEGFPLNGKTLFSIGHLNKASDKFNLIVGGEDNFLYNYQIE